jgi:hypothetical protein
MKRLAFMLAMLAAPAAARAEMPGAAWQCFGYGMLPATGTFELGIVAPATSTPSVILVFGRNDGGPAESVRYDGQFLSFGYRGRAGWILGGALETATHRLDLSLQNTATGKITRFEGDCLPQAGTLARPW